MKKKGLERFVMVSMTFKPIASRFSDHMIALKAGKLMKTRTPDESYDKVKHFAVYFEIEAKFVPCPETVKANLFNILISD